MASNPVTTHDELLTLLDKATTSIAEIGIIRDELKKDGRLTEEAKVDLAQQLASRREIATNEYWEFAIKIANIRWESLDIE
jgi:hypothetical protein